MKLDDCPSCSSYSKIRFMIATRTDFPITLVILLSIYYSYVSDHLKKSRSC